MKPVRKAPSHDTFVMSLGHRSSQSIAITATIVATKIVSHTAFLLAPKAWSVFNCLLMKRKNNSICQHFL